MSPLNLVDLVYTPAEVQAILKIGKSSMYELLWTGALPYTKVGRLIRISRQDLEAFLNRSEPAAR